MPIDTYATATELAGMIRRKEISSRELLRTLLERAGALNPALNAIVTLDAERALAEAGRADNEAAHGAWRGPLHGLPMTVKDCFETAGLRTTSGDPDLANYVPASDAVAVARLKAAGAIVFGKTNTPLQAMDVQTDNPLFGRTNNPWDSTRSPGGSSGGAAAALAAGLTPLELGSDIGGSIRIPAHCCGVFGHKPSWGIVPGRGHIPGPPGTLHERDITVNGPLARSASDLALALDVLAGPDELDGAGWRLELPPPRHLDLSAYRVATWLDDPYNPTERALLGALQSAASALAAAGATVDTTPALPCTLEQAFAVFRPLMNAALAAVTGDEHSHRAWLEADETRQILRRQWAEFFERYDVLLVPPLCTTAIPHYDGSVPFAKRTLTVDGVGRPFGRMLAWSGVAGASLLPATVIPVGIAGNGLPAGVQIIGPYLGDRTTLTFAALASQVLGGFRRPPDTWTVQRPGGGTVPRPGSVQLPRTGSGTVPSPGTLPGPGAGGGDSGWRLPRPSDR